MKVLLDINVLLDVFLVRRPWFNEASQVWDAHMKSQITVTIAAFTLPTIFYVVRRQIDLIHGNDAIRLCLATFEIAPVWRTTLELALTLPGSDYEDNLQLACALETQQDALVTRDQSGYPASTIPILTPGGLVARLGPGNP